VLIEIIKAIIIGIIEGITEWLPISSTGHMIIAEEFLKFESSAEFMDMFRVVVQLGAILAVIALYFNKLNPLAPRKSMDERKGIINLWLKVLIASVPAGIIGVLFDDWLTEKFYNPVTVACTLILYGILFIVVEGLHRGKKPAISNFSQLTYKTALLIGFFQVLSLIPGTSRSGATIIGALILGASRYVAAEFSFFMAIPVMFGASLIKVAKFGWTMSGAEMAVLITGVVVSFLVSVLAIKFLLGYIRRNNFKVFGYYRIVLGILVLAFFML